MLSVFGRICRENYLLEAYEYQFVIPVEHCAGCATLRLEASITFPGYFYLLGATGNYVDTKYHLNCSFPFTRNYSFELLNCKQLIFAFTITSNNIKLADNSLEFQFLFITVFLSRVKTV
jgi:hypothetical protein